MAYKYAEDIYAGVLGKIIGVYLGRPVEGWPYDRIRERFGEIVYYVHKDCGVPLVVADDDISGTFGFFRALEDNDYRTDLTAGDIGDTWLNYIVEDKTILWWGGLGRSTEHTAYLNLKHGVRAPTSGSIAQNGKTIAEQIGAQIFIDAFAMACPNDPGRAVDLARKAASVSHDGTAVEAACFLAAMESLAFEEKNIDRLLDRALPYVADPLLLGMIADVREYAAAEKDWRKVRELIDAKYGYDVFPGPCHVIPNHAIVLASLLLGGDDFQRSISIAASAAWDTDCNAGNVGALNGIRLGLAGIDAGADFRTPVADLLWVVTSDGGSTMSNAVDEARRIVRAACAGEKAEHDLKDERYSFEFKGSIQGFSPCPYHEGTRSGVAELSNLNENDGEDGLLIRCDRIGAGECAEVSAPTFLEFESLAGNFPTIASPTLYSSQPVAMRVRHFTDDELDFAPYVLYYDRENRVRRIYGKFTRLSRGTNSIGWTVPDTEGMPIFRIGCSIRAEKRFSGSLALCSIDWRGAPARFEQHGMMMPSIWSTNPFWLQMWVSSARNFAADFKFTYCVSHPEENGVATIGTRDWVYYSVSSGLCFSLHEEGGLVVRSRGHRRYYAALLSGHRSASIVRRRDEERVELARTEFPYAEDALQRLEFQAEGPRLRLIADGNTILEVRDSTYGSGAAGFLISRGTMTADGFCVRAL